MHFYWVFLLSGFLTAASVWADESAYSSVDEASQTVGEAYNRYFSELLKMKSPTPADHQKLRDQVVAPAEGRFSRMVERNLDEVLGLYGVNLSGDPSEEENGKDPGLSPEVAQADAPDPEDGSRLESTSGRVPASVKRLTPKSSRVLDGSQFPSEMNFGTGVIEEDQSIDFSRGLAPVQE